jgi:hypothetical protein
MHGYIHLMRRSPIPKVKDHGRNGTRVSKNKTNGKK